MQKKRIIFEVFIVTREPFAKVRPVLRELEKSNVNGFSVHVLSGASEIGNINQVSKQITVSSFPGESVFHLRSRIPALAKPCEWVVILEDHNIVGENWPELVASSLSKVGTDIIMVVGAATNLKSTDPWSWANFLSVFGFHWAPIIQEPTEAIGFNVCIRRKFIGVGRLELGEYETEIVPAAMKSAIADPSFPVDHMQFRKFPEVLYHHWYNGRVTGSFMRKFDASGFRKVLDHARNTTFRRQRILKRIIKCHPNRDSLPKSIGVRMLALAIAHSLGCIYGGLTGVGRAPWELE
ncbi:MAG: hypothetical protein HOM55_07755 [Proteobacteria bacterium]|nr:hypothetical protein [Pseudomonadota bacterium]